MSPQALIAMMSLSGSRGSSSPNARPEMVSYCRPEPAGNCAPLKAGEVLTSVTMRTTRASVDGVAMDLGGVREQPDALDPRQARGQGKEQHHQQHEAALESSLQCQVRG